MLNISLHRLYNMGFKIGHKTRQGQHNYNFKTGRWVTSHGYVKVWVDFQRYEYEHRLVMKEFLGRELTSSDLIHHINGNKQDNRIENLELTTRSKHINIHR